MKVNWKAIVDFGSKIGVGGLPGAIGVKVGLSMGQSAAESCHSILNSCANAPDVYMYAAGGLAVGIVVSVVVFKSLF